MGGPKVRAAFVGRGPELERLDTALSRTAGGMGVTILCGGEAGVGKTRLVAEFGDRAAASGCAVLSGGCVDLGLAGIPYGPFAEALRTAIAHGTLDPDRLHHAVVDQLAILVPDLTRDSTAGPGPRPELTGLGQARLFEAVLAAIRSAGNERPVVLVIEDLHWADRSTLDLLSFLARNAETSGFMIVVTVRTDAVQRGDPLAATLGELSRRSAVERLDLAPFDLEGTMEHLRAIVGVDVGDLISRRIHGRSDGNAFFIEQLGQAHLDGEDVVVPSSLRDILLNHISRQAPDVQSLLAAAAVAGSRVDEGLLAGMTGRSEEDILGSLRAAVDGRLLVPIRDREAQGYRFRHALMEEAVLSDLLEGDRRRLHGRCATVLAARRSRDGADLAERTARIAHHRDRAGDIPGTIVASIDAALASEAISAHGFALTQYRRALDLLEGGADVIKGEPHPGWDLAEVFHRGSLCAAVAGEPRQAARWIRDALARLPGDADPFRRGALLVNLSEHLWLAGDDGFLEALALGADTVPAHPPTAVRADALVSLGYHHQIRGEPDEAWAAFVEARATAIAAGADRDEAMARTCLAMMLLERGDLEGSAAEVTASLAAIERAPAAANVSVAYIDLAAVAGWSGDDELGAALSRRGIAVAKEHGFETFYGAALAASGAEGLLSLGRLCEASELLDSAEVIDAGGWSDATRHITRAAVMAALGQAEEARAGLAASAGWADLGDRTVGRWRAVVEAEFTLEQGRPEDVAAVVRAGLDLPPTHVPWEDHRACLGWLAIRAAADLAERARARRDRPAEDAARADAAAAVAELLLMLETPISHRNPTRRRANAYLAMATAEMSRVEDRSDPAAWSAARTAWDGLNWVLRPLYARIREAEAHLDHGREHRPEAIELLIDAHLEAIVREARPLSSMTEDLGRRARVDLPTESSRESEEVVPDRPLAGPASVYGLTERETEILGLLATGLTNREIGERLFISPKTAGVHVSNILGKLGVTGRVQAATVAQRLGVSVPADAGVRPGA